MTSSSNYQDQQQMMDQMEDSYDEEYEPTEQGNLAYSLLFSQVLSLSFS